MCKVESVEDDLTESLLKLNLTDCLRRNILGNYQILFYYFLYLDS